MRLALKLHPDSRCEAVTGIEVEAKRTSFGTLILRYDVSGRLDDIRIPSEATPTPGDELWRHTCFEAFVRGPQSAAYLELNFSPSMQWAAYQFSGYRSGMLIASEVEAPSTAVQSSRTHFALQTSLKCRSRILSSDATWQIGLAAVIEEASGRMSYWALKHPPGKADFHHSDCLAHALPPTSQP